ncbi:MAG: hypothetical protein AB1295_03020 [Candidatus Micrarchaeota archaeon]
MQKQNTRNGTMNVMTASLTAYKEVHRPRNAIGIMLPLNEGIQGDKYLCRITLTSGHEVNISANSLELLGSEVNRVLARYPKTDVSDISFMPPDGVKDRQFLAVSTDLKVVGGRRQSSGRWMVAMPLPLDDGEQERFREKAASG